MFSHIDLKKIAVLTAKTLYCHRAIYAGLAACHGSGCFLTWKPELYGPMALLYALLALMGDHAHTPAGGESRHSHRRKPGSLQLRGSRRRLRRLLTMKLKG